MSICRYGGIYDFIELGGRESAVGREERGRKKKNGVWTEKKNRELIFVSNVFPSTYGPCFGLYTEDLRGDP